MNKNADPLEAIIDFAWASGADLFFVQNAKDELKKLKEMSTEISKSKQFIIAETNRWLSCEKEIAQLKNLTKTPVAWARINERGDLFDLRLCNNIHVDQSSVVPLYRK